MRISDWSSDVCSSDLLSWWVKLADGDAIVALHDADFRQTLRRWSQGPGQLSKLASSDGQLSGDERYFAPCTAVSEAIFCSSEERRVVKECVSPCRSRWSPSY